MAVARIMQAWADDEHAVDGGPLAMPGDGGVRLHAALVASLSEPDAHALGLPPAARLSINLQSVGVAHQPEFRIETRWTRPNGLPAAVRVDGARVSYDGKDWRIAEPIWSIVRTIDRLNRAGSDADRQAALAELRAAIGDHDRSQIRADGFIERLRLSYAAGFSLSLRTSAGGFDFDPVLFGLERLADADDGAMLDEAADSLLPPNQQAVFARRFRTGDTARRAYLLDDGAILFLDQELQRALSVVRKAQAGGSEARRSFARNPQRMIAEAFAEDDAGVPDTARLFVETQQFSERVSGIDEWRKPVLPWIKPKPNSWLPEAFGLRIGEPPATTTIEIPPERLPEALAAVELAVREERATFDFRGQEVPATEQTRAALADLGELVHASQVADTAASDVAPASLAGRYFLQVRDNLEDVTFAPIVRAAATTTGARASIPETIRSSPKPHQTKGFDWLVSCWRNGSPGALLADDMGLGKTYQALAFLAWLRIEQPAPRPVLIVAPTGLLANWRGEINRHLAAGALGRVVNAYGDDLRRMRSSPNRDIESGSSGLATDDWASAGVVLTTYETMRDYHFSFARQPFAVIIYDEVQKLKNPASQMTRAAKTLNARFQLAMTGTPVENRLQDLWSILDVVHPGLLGSSKTFEAAYPGADPERLRALHDLLALPQDARPPLMLRRMKDDCLVGLPTKTIRALPTPMPPLQARAYEELIQRAVAARGTGKRGNMLEVLHMLRGVSLHPIKPEAADARYFDASARLAATFATLDAIHALGEKVLIFCESLAMQALLAMELKLRYRLGHDVPRIHGGVQGDARQAHVEVFQARPAGFDVMILSPKAGGVGLTLTAANHVIHLSRWWNPAVEDQATDRAFRIGQTRDVVVYLPQAVHPDPALGPTSFDLKLDALMTRKRALSRDLLIPGDEDSDTDDLIDAVLGEGVEEPLAEASAEAEQPLPRPTLSVSGLKPDAPSPRSWPSRKAYVPKAPRDHAIFFQPVAGERIAQLTIRDPYGCADNRNRQALADFVAMLAGSAKAIDAIQLVSFDAESCDRLANESDALQRADVEQRLRSALKTSPELQQIRLSKRQSRTFHDRNVKAVTQSGRTIVWDISNGLDGVMLANKECVVHVSEG